MAISDAIEAQIFQAKYGNRTHPAQSSEKPCQKALITVKIPRLRNYNWLLKPLLMQRRYCV
jgi:hypothetical protein